MALVLVRTSLVHAAPDNLYTNYEARKSRAATMLKSLYSAARNRADRVRAAEGKDPQEAVPSSSDMFARLLDYSADKLSNPPLKSVETNILVLSKALQLIAAEVDSLAKTSCKAERSDGKDCAKDPETGETNCDWFEVHDGDGVAQGEMPQQSAGAESVSAKPGGGDLAVRVGRTLGEIVPVQGPKYTLMT